MLKTKWYVIHVYYKTKGGGGQECCRTPVMTWSGSDTESLMHLSSDGVQHAEDVYRSQEVLK